MPAQTHRRNKTTGRRRLSGSQRREQLLEAVRHIIDAEGIAAVTMERVAERAGVSRALVYLHFDNSEQVLMAVLKQELTHIEDEHRTGMRQARSFEELVRAATKPYEDAFIERGSVFRALVMTPLSLPDLESRRVRSQQRAIRFWSELAQKEFGLTPDVANAATTMLLKALEGPASYAWSLTKTPPGFLTDVYTALVVGGVRELSARMGSGSAEGSTGAD